jgi:hypothetical protein
MRDGGGLVKQRGRAGRIAIPASAVVVLIAFAVSGVWAASRLNVEVPVDAPATVMARTVMTGPVTPDATDGEDTALLVPSPYGQVCLDRIERAAGPLDLCWEVTREPADADPRKDYYRLRVYGSFGGGSGSGVRWVVVKARLVGEPMDQVFVTWPTGTYEGSCEQVMVGEAGGLSGQPMAETVCGRTSGIETPGAGGWSLRVTWTCEGCLFASHDTRSIGLYELVGVPEGMVPAWDISADLGG